MNNNKYQLAGWLSIISGIIYFLNSFIENYFGFRMVNYPAIGIITYLLNLLILIITVFVFLKLRSLLNSKFDFYKTDKSIIIFIIFAVLMNVVFLTNAIDNYSEGSRTISENFSDYLAIIYSLVLIYLSITLLRLKERSTIKVYNVFVYTLLYTGTGILFTNTGIIPQIPPLAYISTLSILGIIMYPIILGIMFLRLPEEVEFV